MFNFKKINKAFIIAEAGVNHEGSLKEAIKLVRNAKKSGADAIKFQTYKSELYVSRTQKERLERVKKFELSFRDFEIIYKECEKNKIIFFSTPLDNISVDFLNDKVPFFKISSGDITNYPLIEHIAKKNKPIILSTGGATLNEINKAIKIINNNSKINLENYLCLMHCVTLYPTLPEDANLLNITLLKEKYKFSIGYSDHTLGTHASLIAKVLGANFIEKHFTSSRKNKKFHDHHISLNPLEMKKLVDKINDIDRYLGNYSRKIDNNILKNLPYLRRSFAVKNDIKKNNVIREDDLVLLRPATGYKPSEKKDIIGKRTSKKIKSYEIIKKGAIIK